MAARKESVWFNRESAKILIKLAKATEYVFPYSRDGVPIRGGVATDVIVKSCIFRLVQQQDFAHVISLMQGKAKKHKSAIAYYMLNRAKDGDRIPVSVLAKVNLPRISGHKMS